MKSILSLAIFFVLSSAYASELKVGDPAPIFTAQTHEGKTFDLASRKGQWTVLYFYPKAETPGCTKQACAYRDNIKNIRATGADVFGVSADNVEAQAKFHENHHLNFTLIADPDDKIIKLYGTKMPVVGMSKRWTFIIDPNLKIRGIDKDVDPVIDAKRVGDEIAKMKTAPQK